METHILELMRRRIYEELLYFSGLTEMYGRRYLVPLGNLDQLVRLHQLGCVFTAGSEGEQYMSQGDMQLSNKSFTERGLPFYNIRNILGNIYTKQLEEKSTVFRGVAAVVLRGTRTIGLQKRIWKLRAYNK
jgi:hypothetical protein